jgi:18S rRNA (guanine1575-N7)-methyltransferase
MSRPEGSSAPDLFYDDKEARKYDQSSRMNSIQVEITNRAIEMLSLPEDRPSYILDIGCGSGLSGKVLEDQGHYWCGSDISTDMLNVASERDSESGDLVHHDSGLGLPFRPGSFDGVISISAIQWLCYASSSDQDPKMRLNRFFSSLYSVLKRDAKAVLQFYPESAEQAALISQAASRVGFAGGIVVDYPNSSRAKKVYLCLSFERSYTLPTALGTEGTGGVTVVNRAAVQDRNSRSARNKKDKGKTKEWIMAKKARGRRMGKEVKSDSKYTGRKRKDKF